MSRTVFTSPIGVKDEALGAGTDAGNIGVNAVSNCANIHYVGTALEEGGVLIDDAYSDISTISGLKAGIYQVVLNFVFNVTTAGQIWDFKLTDGGVSIIFGNASELIRSITGTTGSGKPQLVSITAIMEVLANGATLTFKAQNDPAGGGTIRDDQFHFSAVRLYTVTDQPVYS